MAADSYQKNQTGRLSLAATTEFYGNPVHDSGAPLQPRSLSDSLAKAGCPIVETDYTMIPLAMPPDTTLLVEAIPKSEEKAMGGSTFKRPLGGPNSPLRPGNPGYIDKVPATISEQGQFMLSETRLILNEIPPGSMFNIPKPGRTLAKAILRGENYQEARPFARLVFYDGILCGGLSALHSWSLQMFHIWHPTLGPCYEEKSSDPFDKAPKKRSRNRRGHR